MDFETHLEIIRQCRTLNVTRGALVKHIYEMIHDHEGKDFNGISDLLSKLYGWKRKQRD